MVVASYQENGEKHQNFEEFLVQKKIENIENPYEIFRNYSNRNDTISVRFSNFYVRKHKPSGLDIVISIWIIGQTLHEMKHLIEWGIYNYLYSSTNTVNLCMNVLYVSSYGIAYATMFLVRQSLTEVETEAFWTKVSSLDVNDTMSQIQIYKTFYWLNSGKLDN
jgi:hypothetical protein